MAGLGWQELTIVLVIVIIIFGAGKLPEIGGALGKSIKEFKTNSEEEQAIGWRSSGARICGYGKPYQSPRFQTRSRSLPL